MGGPMKYLALVFILAVSGFTAVAWHAHSAGPEIRNSQAAQMNVYDLTVKAGNLPDTTVAAAF